jgi:hypothetical protein
MLSVLAMFKARQIFKKETREKLEKEKEWVDNNNNKDENGNDENNKDENGNDKNGDDNNEDEQYATKKEGEENNSAISINS